MTRPPRVARRALALGTATLALGLWTVCSDAAELAAGAKDVDDAIARLVADVDAAGLSMRTDFVIVSDHGMAPLSRERTIVLDDYLDVSTIDIVDISPILGVNPRHGSAEPLYQALRDKHPVLHVYRRDELRLEYRLLGHPRLASVIGVADEGWHITTRAALVRNDDRLVAAITATTRAACRCTVCSSPPARGSDRVSSCRHSRTFTSTTCCAAYSACGRRRTTAIRR